MTIGENYINKLQKKPSYQKNRSFHWADYIELLCLANIDGEFSKMDVIDRLAEREEDLEESSPDDLDEIKSLNDDDSSGFTQRYKKMDKWNEWVSSWFNIIEYRINQYGSSYPFRIDNDDLILNYDSENIKHKYYLFLLLCSNLYLLNRQVSEMFSSYFEVISLRALKSLLPDNARVILFGRNSLNDDNRYGRRVNCLNKIKNLAEDLKEQLSPHLKEEDYSNNNYGDDGLDLVAWLPTGDDQNSRIVILGQCACTTEWEDKQSSSSYEKWGSRINFTTMPINATFIPFCFRKATGSWFKESDLRKTFLVDRRRTLHYLEESQELDSQIVEVVNSLLETKESIF